MAPSQGGPICDEVQLQTASVCVPDPKAWAMDALTLSWEDLDLYGFSPSSPPDKCSDKGSQPSVQKDDNSNLRLAEHVLVLGSGGDVISNPSLSSQPTGSPVPTVQRQPSQGSAKSEPSCLAPRAKNIREEGFSDQVATRIEAPQRRSTRFVYEAKWAVFVRWCKAHQVDFHAPSVEQIADFFLHLFQDRKLQPSTIDGYRSAIADKVGNFTVNISKNENLNRLLDSFHRDRPKGR